MLRSRTAAIAAVLLLASISSAFAHAHLVSAEPAPGATVASHPGEVVIHFTEAVEPRFCTIEVDDAANRRIDKQDQHTAPGDAKTLVVGTPALAAGVYKVIWHATSVDTHKTEGSYTFTVAP